LAIQLRGQKIKPKLAADQQREDGGGTVKSAALGSSAWEFARTHHVDVVIVRRPGAIKNAAVAGCVGKMNREAD
jgi:hypothetical protein